MKYNKLPITIPEQVEKLKRRGLKFDNETKAQNNLSNISYYRLRAYTYPFQNNSLNEQPFNVDVSFEQMQAGTYQLIITLPPQ